MGLAPRPDSEDFSRNLTTEHAASAHEAESDTVSKSPPTSSDQSSHENVLSEQALTYDRPSAHRHHNFYSDTAGGYFPISPDHQLLTVIAHNVCRAILTNTSILAKVPSTAFASNSCCEGLRTFELTSFRSEFPPTLRPTQLQELVPHLPWIDLFPSPRLRDNLIAAFTQKRIDHEELVEDLIGSLFDDGEGMKSQDNTARKEHGANAVQNLGLVAWADPWDIGGWEMTELFIRKWKFLLAGCVDVIAATNNWRRLRGEEKLLLELYQ
jgi:hypothetical protein